MMNTYLSRWFKLVPTKTMIKTLQIWNEFTKLFQQTTTSTKVSSTLTLTNFSFDGRKAVEVKKVYEAITRQFQAAFGGQETISVAQLSACLLLAIAFDLSNPTVWNNDSGASHNITPHGNKAGILSYSSSSTEIQIADGSVIHATKLTSNFLKQSFDIGKDNDLLLSTIIIMWINF